MLCWCAAGSRVGGLRLTVSAAGSLLGGALDIVAHRQPRNPFPAQSRHRACKQARAERATAAADNPHARARALNHCRDRNAKRVSIYVYIVLVSSGTSAKA